MDPNFHQIPINRPHAPVNDMFRDGFHQDAVHGGVAPYRPNSLDGGCPFHATGAKDGAFVEVAARVAESTKVRELPASFEDHYSQVRQFWLSMTPPEKEHIAPAYTFELAKCYEQAIKERQLLALANIDPDLCAQVAAGLGLPAPEATVPLVDLDPSPALSQVGDTWPTDGRMIGIVVDPDGDLSRCRGLGGSSEGGQDGAAGCGSARRKAAATGWRSSERSGPPGPSSSTPSCWPVARLRVRTRWSPRQQGGRLPPPLRSTPGSCCWCRSASAMPRRIGAWGAGVQALELAGASAEDPGS